MKLFTALPFFRILIPFISGILMALTVNVPAIHIIYPCVLIGLLLFINFYTTQKKVIMLLADVFLFVYGIMLVGQVNTEKSNSFYGRAVHADNTLNFIAVIHDQPIEKEKTVACNLELLQVKTGNGYAPVTGSIKAYFKKPVVLGALTAGHTLLIRSTLQEVSVPQNPYEFDYKNYLYNRQIYHTAFIDAGSFKVLPAKNNLNPVWLAGLYCKQVIMQRLKNSALSENAYSICCALLTGYDDEIDKQVMNAFSHSGTLHVLSVSGLHTGLIYLVLSFLFDLFDRDKKYKLLKFSMITFVLWFFALITGFSPPVLRAVIMFNLFGLGKIYFRNDYRNQLNILLVSAFILLCDNPFFITDVGFLLSYFALAGLIYFQPLVSALWQPQNRLINYGWQSISASFAATISTLPLTLFYFKQFPLWFFICNLVVVPATFIILFLAVLVVCKLGVAAILINYLTAMLISFINVFNSDRFGFIDNIHFVFTDVIYLSLLIVFISVALKTRSYRSIISSISLIILWQLTALVSSYVSKQETLFSLYHIKNKSVVSVKNKTSVYHFTLDSASYKYHIKPHFISFNNPELNSLKFNYVAGNKHSILILDTLNFWPQVNESSITIMILTNNFKITEADLKRFGSLKWLVADGSNNNYTIKKAEELSRNFGLNFYNTRRKGAYLLTL